MKKPTPVSNHFFTLLEILVGVAVLALVAGLLGWRGREAVTRKQFDTEIALLKHNCEVCQKLAVATQTDWKGTLRQEGGGWVFETVCVENAQMRPLKPVRLHKMAISFNRAPISQSWTIRFFSTGKVSPEGTLSFVQAGQQKEVKFPDLFGQM